MTRGVVVDRADALAEVALRAEIGDRLGSLDVLRVGQLGLAVGDRLERVGAEVAEDVAADEPGDRPALLAGCGKGWTPAALSLATAATRSSQVSGP